MSRVNAMAEVNGEHTWTVGEKSEANERTLSCGLYVKEHKSVITQAAAAK